MATSKLSDNFCILVALYIRSCQSLELVPIYTNEEFLEDFYGAKQLPAMR